MADSIKALQCAVCGRRLTPHERLIVQVEARIDPVSGKLETIKAKARVVHAICIGR